MTTLIDFIPVLADPIGYVTGMLSNFVAYGYDEETSTIRVGVTAQGSFRTTKLKS
jgi:hypothetical protein